MTTIIYEDPELIVALNKKVVFFYPEDLQIFKEIELPDDLEKCGLKPTSKTEVTVADGEDGEQVQSAPQTAKMEPIIQHVCLSSDRQNFAITTTGQKAVLLYKCRPEHGKLMSVRSLARTSSTMCFSSDSKLLLVMDKSGDCYEYDCVDADAEPRLLFGHLSIVYGLQWTSDQKFIITADRDDKIRVTNYPETYDIHGYCLGHREFVSAVTLLQDDFFISISGDKSLRLWNYRSCKELGKCDLPAPGIRMTTRKLNDCHYQVAVLLYQPEENVGIYDIKNVDGNWEIKEMTLLNFPSINVGNLCFAKDRLFVAGATDDRFVMELAPLDDARPTPEHWLQMACEQFKTDTWKLEDVSVWFKKRFDNVSEYLERKKRRIEEKQSN